MNNILIIFISFIVTITVTTPIANRSLIKSAINTIEQQSTKISQLQNRINNFKKHLNIKSVKTVTVTAYSARKVETDDTPTITASMTKVREGTVAVSRDLFNKGWVFGKKIYIQGYGIFEINDLMHSRYTERIDIFMWSTNKAYNFGKKNLVAALLEL